MRTKIIVLLIAVLFTSVAFAQQNKAKFDEPLQILVFSKTNGYRHASISSGIKMLYDQSKKQNWVITATEDPTLLRDVLREKMDIAVLLMKNLRTIQV